MFAIAARRAGKRALPAWAELASVASSSLGAGVSSCGLQVPTITVSHQAAGNSNWATWSASAGHRSPPAFTGSWAAARLHTSPPRQQQQQDAATKQQQQSSSPATASSSSSSSRAAAASADPAAGTWVARLPRAWQPYALLMRLDKPIGTWLLAWPCFWSIAMAAPPGSLPDVQLLGLFGAGALLLRGAGCTINDLWDRELDKQVERTRSRPLAAGTVTPTAAVAFLGAQLSLGLGILLQLNWYSQLLGASSLALVATYPLMKRVTGWPQAYLGLTYNWGALLGWAAARGACDWSVVLPLYASGVCWTLVYDTIYAHQDKQDDVKVGIKSTALTFGDRTKAICGGFAAAQTGLLCAAGAALGAGAPYYAGVAAVAAHVAWQLGSVDLDDTRDCMAKFVSNRTTGGLLLAGIVADRLLASGGAEAAAAALA